MEENDIYSISAINNLIDKKISCCDDFKKIKIRVMDKESQSLF